MKKILILLLVMLLAGLTLTACGDDDKDDKKDSPVDTVRAYFNAFADKNMEKMQEKVCADATPSLQIDPTMFEAVESIRFEDAQYNEVSQNDTSAVVHVQGDLIAAIAGTEEADAIDENVQLNKVDGEWCLFTTEDAVEG